MHESGEEIQMKNAHEGIGRVWILAACLAVLSGCQKQEGPMESAGRNIDEAGDKVARDVDRAADRAGDNVDDATRKAGERIERAGEKIQDAAGK